MKKLVDFTKKLTRGDVVKLKVYRHPNRRHNLNLANKVGLTRNLTFEETVWLNKNTSGLYSVDKIGTKRNVSFKEAKDALLFKLAHSNGLTCKAFEG